MVNADGMAVSTSFSEREEKTAQRSISKIFLTLGDALTNHPS